MQIALQKAGITTFKTVRNVYNEKNSSIFKQLMVTINNELLSCNFFFLIFSSLFLL